MVVQPALQCFFFLLAAVLIPMLWHLVQPSRSFSLSFSLTLLTTSSTSSFPLGLWAVQGCHTEQEACKCFLRTSSGVTFLLDAMPSRGNCLFCFLSFTSQYAALCRVSTLVLAFCHKVSGNPQILYLRIRFLLASCFCIQSQSSSVALMRNIALSAICPKESRVTFLHSSRRLYFFSLFEQIDFSRCRRCSQGPPSHSFC